MNGVGRYIQRLKCECSTATRGRMGIIKRCYYMRCGYPRCHRIYSHTADLDIELRNRTKIGCVWSGWQGGPRNRRPLYMIGLSGVERDQSVWQYYIYERAVRGNVGRHGFLGNVVKSHEIRVNLWSTYSESFGPESGGVIHDFG